MSSNLRARVIGSIVLLIGLSLLVRNLHMGQMLLLTGALLFLAAALFFGRSYLQRETDWWMILPAGVSFTVGIIWLLSFAGILPDGLANIIFLGGAALSFWAIWMEKTHRPYAGLAQYPALLLTAGALLAFLSDQNVLRSEWIVPSLLFLTGLLLVSRNWSKRGR
ncbi:hypothetical protein GX408_12865 [bacterium]|nr:hypothetical protein [bacterium]